MYNEVIIKDPTTPQTRRHTTRTSWNVNVKNNGDKKKEMFCLTINLDLI